MVDWGKWGDALYDGAGDVVDKGKEIVGTGIDKGTDVLGSGLEKVGADEWADAVEDWGDETASSLGAEVGEQQLGQTEEADELIHGRPEKISAAVKNLRDFQKAFDLVGGGMKKLDSGHWKGEAADAFRVKFQTLPTDWLRAADAFEDAAKALETFANTVTSAQGKAGEAIALYKEGKQDYETAAAAFREKAEAYNAVRNTDHPLPHPGKFSDPGAAKRQHAQEILQRARRARNEAGEAAKGAITAALAHAPKEPTGLDRAKQELIDYGVGQGIELAHVGGGVIKASAGLVNFVRSVNPTDPYNLTHPAEYYKGVNMTLAGLVSTAANPDRALKNAWDAAKGDPSEFIGRLIPELIGTKGGGFIRGGLRAGMREVGPGKLPDEWMTGARRRPRDLLDDPAQTRWAEDAYDSFLKDSRDVSSIADHSRDVQRGNGSTGFSSEEIASVKKHVFDTEHPIVDPETGKVVIRKFDADAEIADAWIRLRSGNALPEDHILLEHEIAELGYLRDHPGSTYQEAHRFANEDHNWEQHIPLFKREDLEGEW
ncbi:putative T7SS-secreted protein [Streptomyces sp. NPDC091271]|uniref:putative T7SS-secreted protein n=1 Tax=Streptomyces sp. NPDC091271 TaxID=3365980 RepID=UPI00380E766E